MSKKRPAKRRAKAKARRRGGGAAGRRPCITEEELIAALDDVEIRRALRLLRLAPELVALLKNPSGGVIEDVKSAVLNPPPPPSPEALALLQALEQEHQDQALPR